MSVRGTDLRAVEILEGELRELVQRRELPLGAAGDPALALLVDQAVADYRDRFLQGGLPVLDDDAVELLHHRVGGFGLLTPFLEDPSIEEIWVNDPGRVFVARGGRPELTNLVMTDDEVEEIVERMLARAGRRSVIPAGR